MTLHAHQLVEALRAPKKGMATSFSLPPEHPNVPKLNEHWHNMSQLINNSGKFFIGSVELLTDALIGTGVEYIKSGILRAPFEMSYLELIDSNNTVIGVALCQGETEVLAYCFARTPSGRWLDPGIIGTMVTEECERGVPGMYMILTQSKEYYTIIDFESIYFAMSSTILDTVGSIALLNAKGVETEKVQAPTKLNKKRKSAGKPPIYEHRVIKIGGLSPTGRVVGVGMDRTSPAMHWRRGHVRTLPTGRKTPVRAALIGKSVHGFISHEYEVRSVEYGERVSIPDGRSGRGSPRS